MRRCCRRAPASATTLIEMIVAMAVASILMTAVYAFFLNGIRYYRISASTLDLQRACLIALTQISSEMAEGSKLSFRTFREDGKQIPGIIFGSPRDRSGEVSFSGQKMLWHKFVCYYRIEVEGASTLIRKEKFIDPPVPSPPVVPAGLTPASFAADPSLNARVVARQVAWFDVTDTNPYVVQLAAADEEAQFRVEISTSLNMRN